MKILIIGGTGVISRSITRLLLDRGDQVTHFNRGITPQGYPSVKVIKGDRKNLASFENEMKSAGTFDCVVDMLCFTPDEANSAIKTFRGRTGHYIFCSSVDVYSKTGQTFPVKESAPRKPFIDFQYAVDKASCEELFFAAHDRNFPITIFRPAQTYGEGGGLVHTLGSDPYYFHRLLNGKSIIVHGDGNSLWVTCHSEDVGRAFVMAAGHPIAYGKAYNVTGEDWMTWNRYHREVAEAIGAPVPLLVHIPVDVLKAVAPELAHWCFVNFQYNNVFDNGSAKNDLHFEQTIPWKEGVQRTFRAMKDLPAMAGSGAPAYYDAILEAWEKATNGMKRELKGITH